MHGGSPTASGKIAQRKRFCPGGEALLLGVFCLFFSIPPAAWGSEPVELSPEAAAAYLKTHPDSTIIDLRTKREFSTAHLPGAINIPMTSFLDSLPAIPAGKPVVIYCGVGLRSAYAAQRLQEQRPDIAPLYVINGWPIFPDTP